MILVNTVNPQNSWSTSWITTNISNARKRHIFDSVTLYCRIYNLKNNCNNSMLISYSMFFSIFELFSIIFLPVGIGINCVFPLFFSPFFPLCFLLLLLFHFVASISQINPILSPSWSNIENQKPKKLQVISLSF